MFKANSTLIVAVLIAGRALADEKEGETHVVQDFENGSTWFEPTDPEGWKVKEALGAQKEEKNHVFSQFVKASKYKPPHRSPFNIALLKDNAVTDFDYNIQVLSTHEDYNHRDAVLVFGYQDASHFYYVHFGKKADDHANQIFIVNDAPRTKISLTSTAGTPWDDKWHTLRARREVASGAIDVYFDDMDKPVMMAKDNTFTWGRVGFGTFDDTADFDNFELRGKTKK